MKYPKTTWEIDSIIPYRTNRWGREHSISHVFIFAIFIQIFLSNNDPCITYTIWYPLYFPFFILVPAT